MENELNFDSFVTEHMHKILSWAVCKTGNRLDGEELTHEVIVQFLSAVSKADKIEKPENLLWKVAYYCWCHYLRNKSRDKLHTELDVSYADNSDFVNDLISKEATNMQILKMRHEVSNLNYLQREAMILHYLDGLSISKVAKRLGTTESAVTWHLFDARKRVRREIEQMDQKIEYIYRPRKLMTGVSGDGGPDNDTKWINGSLIRQNLCLLCYRESKTIDELTSITGIPKPYLEFDLDWLVDREFLSLEGKQYETTFPIISMRHMQDIGTLYRDTRKDFIDRIITYLWENEPRIREIGFYGADFPTERLMWAIIMMFISHVSRSSPLLTKLKNRDNFPIRPDGGKYVVMASDKSEDAQLDPNGYSGEILWGGYSGVWSDSCIPECNTDMYYWLGVNSFFLPQYYPDIVIADNVKRPLLHWIYTSVIEPWFTEDKLEPHGKEALAEAVADGIIIKDGNKYKPNYLIFSQDQLKNLKENIYQPLADMIEPVLAMLSSKISAMHKEDFPKINKIYVDYHTYVDLWDFGIYTLMYAAENGMLWIPSDPEHGVPLTLVIIKE